MEEAEKLYNAMPTSKPAWEQLGDTTKGVWRGFVERGVTVYEYRAGVTFTYELEKLLVERILPLCSAQEIAVLYKNEDPSWPFPLSAVDPKGEVGRVLDLPVPPPTEVLRGQGYSRDKISAPEPVVEHAVEPLPIEIGPQMSHYEPPPEAKVIPPAAELARPLTLKERLALKKGMP